MQIPRCYMVIVMIPVPSALIDRVISIHQQAGLLYKQLGARNVEVLLLVDGAPKYGCLGLADAVPLEAGERLIMVMDYFDNEDTYLSVSKIADEDSAVSELFNELSAIVDISRIVRAEFEVSGVQDS